MGLIFLSNSLQGWMKFFYPAEEPHFWNICPSVTKKQMYLFFLLPHLDTVTSTLNFYNLERSNHIHCLKVASNKTRWVLDQQWAIQDHLQPQKRTSALFSEKLRSQTLLAEGTFTKIISLDSEAWTLLSVWAQTKWKTLSFRQRVPFS